MVFKKGHPNYFQGIRGLDRNLIIKSYLEGKSVKEISMNFNCSVCPVYKILWKNNVKMFNVGGRKGQIPWNKDKKYKLKEIVGESRANKIGRLISKKLSGRKITWGRKISLKKRGKKYPKELYPKWGWRSSRKNQVLPVKDTTIELKIQYFLKQLGINFFAHWYVNEIKSKYQCDIFIPFQEEINQKTIIECDGDYWHGNPKFYSAEKLIERQIKQRNDDVIRTKELQEKGYRVIRLWEDEIRILIIDNFKKKLETFK